MRGARFHIVLFFIFTATFVFCFGSSDAQAATLDLHGWAWSSNIGWVGFNCADVSACATTNYKVTFNDVSGNISGYAWSSNIGWVRFDPASTGCPTATSTPGGCSPKVNLSGGADKKVTGWARACTVFATGCSGSLKSNAARGGWDGWIELSGTNHISPNATGAGGVTYRSGLSKFVGFAWGGDVIGWLNFDRVTITPLSTFTLTVNSVGASSVDIAGDPAIYGGTTNYSRTGILSGTSLSLTAPETVGANIFSSWSGCDPPVSGRTCNVAMTANKSVTVNYTAGNIAPVANAGPDHSSTVGSSHSHTGGVVTDANSNLASYDWDFITCPGACPADPDPVSVSGGSASAPLSYTPTVAGVYTLRLRATDADGLTSTDTAVDTAVVDGDGGSFTLSATPSTITVDASSFFYSFSLPLSEIRVTPANGYNGNVRLSVAGVNPEYPAGFLDLYTPNNVITPAEYGGGTSFRVRVQTSVADPRVDKIFTITLRGTDTGNSQITDDVALTLVVRASDPGGGEQ